ncbi:tripeptidyl-peptidase I [Rhizoctonia solani]|uniref:tripeptidyl-peptidase II n=1 Tax=Rhizoctonia solani TaxID=456999 RepID=A0A0K6GAU4_9AGAM|nr:tripeptidyl-peptidase I [Rhizoctonia solani]
MYVLPILAFAALAAGSPVSHDFTTRHTLHEVPSGWTVVARAPAEHNIDLRIGLKQARMTDLLSILGEVSDPTHARYGKHLSKNDVDELVAPRAETVESVEQWLQSHGVAVSGRSSAGDWIHVTVPYNIYRHTSGAHIVRSESYALPRSLDSHIDLVQPTTYFGRINERSTPESTSALEKRASTVFVLPESEKQELEQAAEEAKGKVAAAVPSSCKSTITPSCLKALYRTDSYTPKAGNSSSIGITGYLEQYASTSDLQTFYTKFNPSAAGSTFSVELVNGGKNSQTNPGIEANLDVQPYLEWVQYILNKTTLPLTISTSYGDDEQTVPLDYATRVCNSFAQLGARGVSVLFSSGDGGVGSGTCKTNDGTNRTRFQPIFPASCPYVTAVGGTYQVSPEVGVSFSQGGFSDYFARPSYQTSAVSTFLGSLGTTYSGLYNTTGRGFPDVAAQGRAFQIVQGGQTTSVAGTSASAPAFAGVIALLNDYRLSQGKPPLGFLNPWLYSTAVSALNDITSGSNPGCGTSGFTARAGWDPVTGLGTPDFVKLQAVA